MRATFKIEDPKMVEASITISATVGEFVEVLEDLKRMNGHSNQNYPLCRITQSMEEAIRDARKSFYGYPEPEGN